MRYLLIVIFFIFITASANAVTLPAWFLKSFKDCKLDKSYIIINCCKPEFLEADFNGDKRNDIAVQIKNIKTGKLGVLIINNSDNIFYVFGAGKKFNGESFDQTKWANGWKISNEKIVYKTELKSNGDIADEKKIKIKYRSIYIYEIEDGNDIAGELIYWNGSKYCSIHQGE